MEDRKKEQPAKRIQLVDVVLEQEGPQLFNRRLVRSPEDATNIICDFIGDSDRERLSKKNDPQVIQVVHAGLINASIEHPRDIMKALIVSNFASCIEGNSQIMMSQHYLKILR